MNESFWTFCQILKNYGKFETFARPFGTAYAHMVSGKELGSKSNDNYTKTILARLAAILAILLFFSARGPKINNIEKKFNEKT